MISVASVANSPVSPPRLTLWLGRAPVDTIVIILRRRFSARTFSASAHTYLSRGC